MMDTLKTGIRDVETGQINLDKDVRIYHLHTPYNPPPSTGGGCSIISQSPLPVYDVVTPARPRFVNYEVELGRSPGQTTCSSCQIQVMTDVTYRTGTFAWLMCLVFILCGLVLGCCLIPFFVRHFKDVYHTCPRCGQVLVVHKKTCC